MTTAVRNTDEKLVSNKKCMISTPMTDLGLSYQHNDQRRNRGQEAHPANP